MTRLTETCRHKHGHIYSAKIQHTMDKKERKKDNWDETKEIPYQSIVHEIVVLTSLKCCEDLLPNLIQEEDRRVAPNNVMVCSPK